MTRLELLAETKEAVVLRMHAKESAGPDDRVRGIVCYVPPSSEPELIASQLRAVADKLEEL
jgi:hypothetical protein